MLQNRVGEDVANRTARNATILRYERSGERLASLRDDAIFALDGAGQTARLAQAAGF